MTRPNGVNALFRGGVLPRKQRLWDEVRAYITMLEGQITRLEAVNKEGLRVIERIQGERR